MTAPTAAPLAGVTQRIPIAAITPSPFNPRKTFDDAGIAELADSIKTQGLLENLVVRPSKGGRFELVAGERRLRALKLAKIEDADCKVLELDDEGARAAMIVENLQREDIPPMEEAAAFDQLNKLDPERWAPSKIAAAIGKTPRFVQQRLGLVRNLSPATKELLKEGEINIETARTLAATPQSLQAKVLERHWDIPKSAEEARERITEHAVPLSAAAFDAALYTGEYIDDGKHKLFGDVALFDKLQREAAKAKVATLKEKWPGAQLVKESALDGWMWGDTGRSVKWNKDHKVAGKTKSTCTAIVYLDTDHKLRVAEGVRPQPKPIQQSHTPARSYQETPERKAERDAFNGKLATAIAKDRDVAIRLMLLDIVRGNTELPTSPKILKAALPKVTLPSNTYYMTPEQAAKLWPKLAGLTLAQTLQALGTIAAAILEPDAGTMWEEHDKACPADLLAIGDTLGVKPEPVKPTLKAIADDKAKAAPAALKPAAKKKAAAKKAASKKKHQ